MGHELAIAVPLLLLLASSLEAGFRLGRRSAAKRDYPGGGQVGAIQGATLGLLGLLLGFSFAGASGRFLERQDLIVQEANAIGTAYLRADVLQAPHDSELRAHLIRYVTLRVELSRSLKEGGLALEASREISRLHEKIWKAASAGVAMRPELAEVVFPPVNEVIDLHATRVAAGRKHLPALLMGLLVGCSAMSMIGLGFGCGLAGARGLMMTGSLTLLIAASLWTTIDLDHPRSGLIRLNDTPLVELKLSLDTSPSAVTP